jgi:hypothetical protein
VTIGGAGLSTPAFVGPLFGYRTRRDGTVTEVPNCADSDNTPSINIARAMLDQLGVGPGTIGPVDPGTALEIGIEDWLGTLLPVIAPARAWSVERHRPVTRFVQYEHLARLQALIDNDETRTLRAEIGSDYLIAPDVTVGLSIAIGDLLHASVSCKWTIRSDRVQNIRHEAVILTRHRRGRQPHIVAVTAEPLPTRIAAIARGTGEVDSVYHVALDPLTVATETHGSSEQRQVLAELIGQRRLFDVVILPETLAD